MKCTAGKMLIIFVLVLLAIFFVFHNTITPIFFSLAETEAIKIANMAINQAVETEAESLNYEDMVRYIYNDQGDIVMMQPDIKYVNNFISRISLNIHQNLNKVGRKTVSIPITRIFGIDLLAGFGPDIKARVLPVGFTKPPQIEDSFVAAGINQTRHKIYLNIVVQLKMIVPFSSKKIDVPATVPVTEVVILGEVPHIYIGVDSQGLSGIMDSIPSKDK